MQPRNVEDPPLYAFLCLIVVVVVLFLLLTGCATTTCPATRVAAKHGVVLECTPSFRVKPGYPPEQGHTCTVATPKGRRTVFVRGCR